MLNKILVPLDGSQLAERALKPAHALAQHAEGSLILLRAALPERMLTADVYSLGGYSPLWPNQSLELARKEADDYLQTLRSRKSLSGPAIRAAVVDGDPAISIVDTAADENVDLIAMSSHGYSGATLWMLGSVAERVLHDASCPVLVVRSAEPIRHILVTLDGSELAEHSLESAFAIAECLNCKVTLFRAIELLGRQEFHYLESLEAGLGRRMQDEMHEGAGSYLHQVANAHKGRAPEIQTMVAHDSPVRAILDYAQRHAVDVIAMSTHGRTGLRRWVYGSVTEKVLRAANCCSMLVTRPASYRAQS
jgi:nucleotide-binding universal stress UspA family protein